MVWLKEESWCWRICWSRWLEIFKPNQRWWWGFAVTQCAHTINRMANKPWIQPSTMCFLVLILNYLISCLVQAHTRPFRMTQVSQWWKGYNCNRAVSSLSSKQVTTQLWEGHYLPKFVDKPGPFEMHSVVMYKRLGGAKSALHHRWHGPARVIGKDIHGYWLVHRGVAVLAHSNNMRRAVEEILDSTESWPKDDSPQGQRGFLDLSKEIPKESLEDDSHFGRFQRSEQEDWGCRAGSW